MRQSNLGESAPDENRSDGRAAYQDGAAYTSPEMRPGHGENFSMRPRHETGGMAALLGGPAAGAALAMEAFTESIDLDKHDPVAKPRFAVVRRLVALVAHKRVMSPGDRPAELLP
jgi:hypothetical protein